MHMNFQDLPCAVLGFGRAGRAAAEWLLTRGARVTAYTETPITPTYAAEFSARGVQFRVGPFPDVFEGVVLVRSPGLRPDYPAIRAALARGARLTSETELFLAHSPCRVIGVTGSDGKTTTTALIAAILTAAGYTVWQGGNNGHPLLPHVCEMHADDIAVLELSSFQLMTCTRAPEVAVLTNLTPNHLNWHTDVDEYAAAKCRIFHGARRLVTNADCAATAAIAARAALPVTCFSHGGAPLGDTRVFPRGNALVLADATGERAIDCLDEFRLPGRHNLENLMAAVGAVHDLVPPEAIARAAREFRGVPHRLQYVDTVNGVKYYNSSIDTSPTRTAAALAGLGGAPLVIAGGQGKGISLTPLADALATHAKAVFLYGETAGEIERLLAGRVSAVCHHRFADAFSAAADAAEEGDTVLLSPGCTAFDQFRDFEHRGEYFCALVAARASQFKRKEPTP